ncbi:MAG: type II toxin-antitoxin system MqsA family antitoxin [Spirochaetales bacterium]|nr:type II toxin-antitoxin system MqsA family antitoxin [Spirochaetales bacterium]
MENKESNYFTSIITGLNEALEVSKGNLQARRRKVTITPVPEFNANKIKEIREALNLSQMIFAEAIGVSVKTVEAWESGRNKPQGPASRFLQLLDQDHSFLEEHRILCI